jgi:beta-lactamase class A
LLVDVRFNGVARAASVFKIPVVVEFYRQVEANTISMDEKIVLREKDKVPGSGVLKELSHGLEVSLLDLVELMMIISDNTATDIVGEKVGLDNVNSTLRHLGLEKTEIVADCSDILFDLIDLNDIPDKQKTVDLFRERRRGRTLGGSWSLGIKDNDVTTPNEMLQLLEMIIKGEAAGRKSCEAIIATMHRYQTGVYRIGKYLPREEVEVADKTGSLPGIRNDVAIVTLLEGGGRYILSFFVREAANEYAAEEAIAQISNKVFDHFREKEM